jgi:hypothetical protein
MRSESERAASGDGDGAAPGTLDRLRALLEHEGGLIATLVQAGGGEIHDADGAGPAALAAQGPRAEGRREEYALLVEAIYEGYLVHYGRPRVVRARDADVGVLAGDRLYAIGLERLVSLGDAEAVSELADTITLSALAQGAGQPALADAIWLAGARAVGWGCSADHERAKTLVLEGSSEALEAMRTSSQALPRTP